MASAPQEVFGAATLGHQQVTPRQNTLPMANDAGIPQAEKKQKNRSEDIQGHSVFGKGLPIKPKTS